MSKISLSFVNHYFNEIEQTSQNIDKIKLINLVKDLVSLKKRRGRLFFLGVGGSAGNCSHAVNDFRKLCNLESYSPLDNVSELTARINDEGWENSLKDWLIASNFKKNDALFILSVGGGNKRKNISTNLIKAIDYAKKTKNKIFGIVGKTDGYLYRKGDRVINIPYEDNKLITPLSESFQAVVWHFLVSHPLLKKNKTKW